MSHFTTIQTRIRDLGALRDACAELGLALLQNTPARGYAGHTRKAEHTIRLKGPYDIAVDPAPGNDGTYGLITDLKQRGMLDETLIIWGGEFGRTIYSQGGLSK